jgi:hypothetical protein
MPLAAEQAPPPEKQRRNRRLKSCRPCHSRKVRCNQRQPCHTCARRNHPQLCSYDGLPDTIEERSYRATESPSGRGSSEGSGSSHSPVLQTPPLSNGNSTTSVSGSWLDDRELPQSHAVRPQQRSEGNDPTRVSDILVDDLLAILNHMAADAISSSGKDPATSQVIFVGSRAHATLFRTLLSYLPKEALPPSASVEAVFGLTNRTTSQPFVSLWNTTARITVGDILSSLPSPDICLRYYRSYQQICHPFFRVILDIGAFEYNLCEVLEQLIAKDDRPSSSALQLAVDLPRAELVGYALIFAVLASGCQTCLIAEGDNQLALHCRVFLACSFECLSLANMYIYPSSETIQAILILASVSCNDNNPGVAMSFLGMAAQHAQGLGLHTKRECACTSPTCECLDTWQPIWRAILILDSKLAMTYDRAPIISFSDTHNYLRSLMCSSYLDFEDGLFGLHCLQIQWQSLGAHDRRTSIKSDVIESHLEHIAHLGQNARSDKSSLSRPTSVQATLEQLVFTIHLDFLEGTLHIQAAIATTFSTERRLHHFHAMISKFCSVLKACLKLRRLSPIAELAWEINRAFKSSALLLASFEVILGVSLCDGLLHKLAGLLAASANRRQWRNDPVPSSCHAGVETLYRLLRLPSSLPVAAEGGAK